MRFFGILFILLVLFRAWPAFAQTAVSCECESLSCGPCELENGVSFYTAKCGANDSKVKSCKRPRCEAVENQNQCFAALDAKAHPVAVAAEPSRAPASARTEAGHVVKVQGEALLLRQNGRTEPASVGAEVDVGDDVETHADGKVAIELVDHSQMTVPANSRVTLERADYDAKSARRQILLNLLQGKVRSHVEKKTDGESAYVVRTKTAVAGVRGTDFVVTYETGDKEWTTRVQTLDGRVHLESVAPNEDKSVEVSAGTAASFVIAAPLELDNEMQLFEKVHQGFVTPAVKLKDDEVRKIEEATRFAAAPTRAVAAQDAATDAVCHAPAGQFNQCSFTCDQTAKGEKRCTSCTRRICRANGVWADPTKLPAADSRRCESGKTLVQDCGGYW